MQDDVVHLAPQNARFDQAEECLEHHFAHAIEALVEDGRLSRGRAWGEPRHHFKKLSVVAMADDQRLRQGIADLPDADLQRAAVAHEARGMQADRVFGIADRFGGRREQRKVGVGAIEHRGKFVRRQIARPGHERQFRIDLPDQLERSASFVARAHDVEGGVGVAAQAVARLAIDHAFCDKLQHDVQSAFQQI